MKHLKQRISVGTGRGAVLRHHLDTPVLLWWRNFIPTHPVCLIKQATPHWSGICDPKNYKIHTREKTAGGSAFSCLDYTAIPCSPPKICSCKLWWSATGWAMNQFSWSLPHSFACIDLSSSEEDEGENKSSDRCSKKAPSKRGSSVTQMRQLRSFRTAILKAVLKRQCVLQLTILVQLFVPLCFWLHISRSSTFKTRVKSPQASVLYS